MNHLNSKVTLTKEEILNRYFMAYRPRWDVEEIKFKQISVDSSLTEVDVTEVVNRYLYSINMFLGANCVNNDKLDFNSVKWLFFSGKQYSKENLGKLGIGFDFDAVPNINLSNNDFGKYNFVWDFGDFLAKIYQNVYAYVYPSFSNDFEEARIFDEEEFEHYGFFEGSDTAYVTREMEQIIKSIMEKLVPVIQNTNIRILINLKCISSLNCRYELIEDILKNHSFDGCYIKVVDFCPEIAERLGLSKEDFEFYQYAPKTSRVRRKTDENNI